MRKGKLNPKLNLKDQHHLLIQLDHLQNKQSTKRKVIAKWQGLNKINSIDILVAELILKGSCTRPHTPAKQASSTHIGLHGCAVGWANQQVGI